MTDSTTRTDIRLTEWTSCGGCAAKWGAAPLSALVARARVGRRSRAARRAGAVRRRRRLRLSDDLALVSTTDFFPPLVDDPADFGAIAAANACSDVFAMGGRVVARPQHLRVPRAPARRGDRRHPRRRRRGGREAAASVAGGHTIRSEEPIFGLAVQGLVHPDRILTKGGARPGDVLVLSKPIGTGIVLAGGSDDREGGRDRPDAHAQPVGGARRCARSGDAAHAVTDVTGFGLAGHGWEMAERSGARLVVRHRPSCRSTPAPSQRPRPGIRTGGDARNRGPPRGPGRRRTALRRARGALLRPADLGRPARRRRPRRRPGRVGRLHGRRPGRGRRSGTASRLTSGARRRPAGAVQRWPQAVVKRTRPAVARRRAGALGRRATRSSSASTRSAGARGPVRSPSAPRCCPQDRRVYKVRDSKMLTEPEREGLFDRIAGWCLAWAVGHATQEECDELGMSAAQRLAARRAIEGLGCRARRGARRRQLGLRRRAATHASAS